MNSMAEFFKTQALCIDHVLFRSFLRIGNFIFRPVKLPLFLLPGLLHLSTLLIFRRGRATFFSLSNSVFV